MRKMSIKRVVSILVLIAVILYLPRVYFSWRYWGLSSETLIQIAAGHPQNYTCAPFTTQSLVSPDVALWLLKNTEFPYNGNLFAGDDSISTVSWVGRTLNNAGLNRSRALDLLNFYLARGEPLDNPGDYGLTPVHEAILYRDPEYLELLIRAGARLDTRIAAPGKEYHSYDAREFFESYASRKPPANDESLDEIGKLLDRYSP
jgi:hypothetical protein